MIRIKELFRLQNLKNLRLIAGEEGLDRTVTAAVLLEYDPSRMQLPDFYKGDLVVTTLAYARGDDQLVANSLLALMNQGIHGVDVFRYLMGPVKTINGIARCLTREKNGQPLEVEDAAAAVLEFENGALGIIEGSTTCFPGYPRRIVISGDKGSVVLEENSIMNWDLGDFECRLPVGAQAKNSGASDPMAIDNSGHVLQIGNLCNAILNGEELLADAYTGRLPLEIILGVYESSETGKTVVLG